MGCKRLQKKSCSCSKLEIFHLDSEASLETFDRARRNMIKMMTTMMMMMIMRMMMRMAVGEMMTMVIMMTMMTIMTMMTMMMTIVTMMTFFQGAGTERRQRQSSQAAAAR